MKHFFFLIFFLSTPVIFHVLLVIVFGYFRLNIELVSFIATLISGMVVLGIARGFGISNFKFTRKISYQSFLKYILLILIFFISTRLVSDWGYLQQFPENGLNLNSSNRSLYYIMGALVIAPFFEELIFRGIGIEYLKRHNFSNISIILITSTVFSIGHLPGLTSLLVNFVLGVFLSVIYMKEKNLSYCVLTHFAYNLLGLILE